MDGIITKLSKTRHIGGGVLLKTLNDGAVPLIKDTALCLSVRNSLSHRYFFVFTHCSDKQRAGWIMFLMVDCG